MLFPKLNQTKFQVLQTAAAAAQASSADSTIRNIFATPARVCVWVERGVYGEISRLSRKLLDHNIRISIVAFIDGHLLLQNNPKFRSKTLPLECLCDTSHISDYSKYSTKFNVLPLQIKDINNNCTHIYIGKRYLLLPLGVAVNKGFYYHPKKSSTMLFLNSFF